MLRVAFVLRSTEVHPVFFWFVPLYSKETKHPYILGHVVAPSCPWQPVCSPVAVALRCCWLLLGCVALGWLVSLSLLLLLLTPARSLVPCFCFGLARPPFHSELAKQPSVLGHVVAPFAALPLAAGLLRGCGALWRVRLLCVRLACPLLLLSIHNQLPPIWEFDGFGDRRKENASGCIQRPSWW